jgi:mycofactocin precursor
VYGCAPRSSTKELSVSQTSPETVAAPVAEAPAPAPATAPEPPVADGHLVEDLLVEDVSIDGMCGVY